MKKSILFLLLISNLISLAQTPKIEQFKHVKPKEVINKELNQSSIVLANKDEILVSDPTKDGLIYTVYNTADMSNKGNFNIKNPKVNNKDAVIDARLFVNDKITNIFSYTDKSKDELTIYGEIIDRENKSIVEKKILKQTSTKVKEIVTNYQIYHSPDNSKILLIRLPENSSITKEKFDMTLFDENLNKIYDQKVDLTDKYHTLFIDQIILTNYGDVTIIASWTYNYKVVEDNPELENSISLKIFKMSAGNGNLEEIEIPEKDKFIAHKNGILINDSLNELVLLGFYAENKNITELNINGFYYIKNRFR